MLEFDKKSNLLMTNRYQYSLQDVAEPNLYRELYDYESIPKVAFNMRHVPENMPDEIWMTDTTFRDGQQSVSPFTVEQIVHLYSLMHRLGGPKGLIRQSEFFLYTDKDKKALHACQDLGYDFPEITTWIRANEKDFELVKQAGVKETGILVSCSDYHIFTPAPRSRTWQTPSTTAPLPSCCPVRPLPVPTPWRPLRPCPPSPSVPRPRTMPAWST